MLLAAVGATAAVIIPAEPLRLNIRWQSEISDSQREELERRFALSSGELREGTTRTYLLIDPSRANIERIVRHPAVEDTSEIDRATFRPLTTSDRTKQVRLWIIVLALAGTALWELAPLAGRPLARPIGDRVGLALIGGAPVLLMTALAGVTAAAMLGFHPFWRESTPNLAHAASEEDLALLERTRAAGGDLNARDAVLINRETVTMTPLEAAVAARSLRTVQWLVTNGASVDSFALKRVQCLADEIDAAEILTYLKTIMRTQDSGSCDGVELPIRR